MTDIHTIQRMIERRRELRRNSTQEENLLWQELRASKLGSKFRRQHSIGGYVADFYCAQARLVIELDGSSHNAVDQKEYDAVRDEFLNLLNHHVLRFRNDEVVANLNGVIKKIKITLDELCPPRLI